MCHNVSVTGADEMPPDDEPADAVELASDFGLLLEQAATDATNASAAVAINIFLCNCPPRSDRTRRPVRCTDARSRAPDDWWYELSVGGRRCLEKVQVAPLICLRDMELIEGRPATQMVGRRRRPRVSTLPQLRVVDFEVRVTHRLYELTFERFVDQRHLLETAVSWTYWNSEFTVVGIAVLWVYLRRHHAFYGFRNSILLANVIGLIGYVIMPMAPPRLLGVGFVNQHRDGLVQLAANPYAAMPSLHAADALIVGVVLFSVCRHWWSKAIWALWPAWVWFAVMATGNHFWLDCVAGTIVALVAMAIVYKTRVRGALAAHRA